MAGIDAGSVFTLDLKWFSRPIVFHRNAGKNLELSVNNSVATRVEGYNAGVVFSSEPVSPGQMLKVIVMESGRRWAGGLELGFTGEDPNTSTLTQHDYFQLKPNNKHLLAISGNSILFNGEGVICGLGFSIEHLTKGQSVGMLLTRQRDLHWFVDDKWRGVVHVDNYPLDKPMWGVMDVFGKCKKIRAEICTVSKYPPTSETQLIKMGIVTQHFQPPVSTQILKFFTQGMMKRVRGNSESAAASSQDKTRLEHELAQANVSNQQLQQQIEDLQAQIAQNTQETHRRTEALQQQLIETQQQLTQANELRQRSDTENQQLIATLRQQNNVLQRRVTSLSAINRSQSSQEVEFWQVSPEEVTIRGDEILGGGAWGYVAKGTFRGTPVAVKRVYPAILQMSTVERIRREIRTMAQIRHPNLILFIAAVLNEQTGPMIVTELLDTSLRSAYQANRVGTSKRKIFGDVSSALVYLHGQREPIIHRDLSSANVLLASQPNDTWLAKLGDFGSANLARYATTPGEGAILYTAPEAYPHPPTSPTPRPPQTTKIDVYSFGVVACEVVTGVFPESDKFRDLLERVGGVWPQIHPLITLCISHSPQDRPTMDTVLSQIRQLDWEP